MTKKTAKKTTKKAIVPILQGVLAVGAQIYRRDHYNVYENGKLVTDPLRKWKPYYVVGETRLSWIFGEELGAERWDNQKILKSKLKDEEGRHRHGLALTVEEYTRYQWVSDNAFFIGEHVRHVSDYDKLYAIATMIGYSDKTRRCAPAGEGTES